MTITEVVNKVNAFLKSPKTNLELKFKEGCYLHLKKRIQEDNHFLEIHTPGYDGTLPATEALEWVKWEIYDYNANGLI